MNGVLENNWNVNDANAEKRAMLGYSPQTLSYSTVLWLIKDSPNRNFKDATHYTSFHSNEHEILDF